MFCISEKKLSEAATPFIVSVDVIYFLRINNVLHHILLYNFSSEEAWTTLCFFMDNFIPMKQENVIEDLIKTSD